MAKECLFYLISHANAICGFKELEKILKSDNFDRASHERKQMTVSEEAILLGSNP